MATYNQVTDALMALIYNAVSTLGVYSIQRGDPNAVDLDEVKSNGAYIVITEHSPSMTSRRWNPKEIGWTHNEIGIAISLSSDILPASGSATLTLSGTPNANDAISLNCLKKFTQVVNNAVQIQSGEGATFSSPTATSLNAYAMGLAAAINARANLNSWLSAAAVSNTVVLTNLTGEDQKISAFAGNIDQRIYANDSEVTSTRISIFAQSADQREEISEAIKSLMSYLEKNYNVLGLVTVNGELVRVRRGGSYIVNWDEKANIFRRENLINLEYNVTSTENLYSILSIIQRVAPS